MGFGEMRQCRAGAGIEYPAAGDDQRLIGLAQRRDRGVEFVLRRTGATQSPNALREEAFRIVESFRLNVLAQRQRNRPALGRIGEHRHGALQRVDDLLGPGDAVEIARHGAKAIVCGNGAVAEILDLLQDGIGPAIGKDIAGQQKKRQTVHMRNRGRRNHVCCSRSDRTRHRHHPAAKARLGESDRGVRHRLLVMRAVGRQLIPHLIERLADGRHVAVAEDRPNAGEKRDLFAFDLRHLPRKITRECLRHSQSDGFHGCLSPLRPLCASAGLAGLVGARTLRSILWRQACQSSLAKS